MAELVGDYLGMDTVDNDFPADISTRGVVETGWKDYGVISQAGDVDWFKVSLTSGQQYRFQIEANPTINGLFSPQLSIYGSTGGLVATATLGQGFQSKYLDFVSTSTADFFLAASGPGSVTGNYILTVPVGTTGVSASTGSGGGSAITGGTGNDTLSGTAGNDSLDGAGGIDTVRYKGVCGNFTITGTAAGYTVKDNTGAEGSDTLVNVERLKFSDKCLALDTGGNAGQVYRVYQAAFNRKPDSGGLGDWMYGMDTGMSLTDVASGFIASPEFSALYGANPSTADLVNRLYQNVLHRAAEKAGFDYWANQLDSGLQTRAQVLAGFSESPENQAAVIGQIQNGFEYTPHAVF